LPSFLPNKYSNHPKVTISIIIQIPTQIMQPINPL
jgi:hypothetical protein